MRITTVYNIGYKDLSFSSTTASNWAFAESDTTIMTVCGPNLRPLFDRMMPKSFLSHRSTGAVGSGRHTRSKTRKAYGQVQLQDYQIELVSGTGGGPSILTSVAATPYSEFENETSTGTALGGGRERRRAVNDLESGIHVQRSMTVMAG